MNKIYLYLYVFNVQKIYNYSIFFILKINKIIYNVN